MESCDWRGRGGVWANSNSRAICLPSVSFTMSLCWRDIDTFQVQTLVELIPFLEREYIVCLDFVTLHQGLRQVRVSLPASAGFPKSKTPYLEQLCSYDCQRQPICSLCLMDWKCSRCLSGRPPPVQFTVLNTCCSHKTSDCRRNVLRELAQGFWLHSKSGFYLCLCYNADDWFFFSLLISWVT